VEGRSEGDTAAGPLHEQEQAALYVVVAEMVDRRLLNPQEESQVCVCVCVCVYMYTYENTFCIFICANTFFLLFTGIPGNIATRFQCLLFIF
jgi:hypothetical protein